MAAVASAHLTRARDLDRASRWEEACAEYAAADADRALAIDDLEAYAEAAQIIGRGEEAIELRSRIFDVHVGSSAFDDAARVGFWLCLAHGFNNDPVQAGGWLKRVARVLDSSESASPWQTIAEGYFLYFTSNFAQVAESLREVIEKGRGEAVPLALCLSGSALIRAGRMQDGLDHLDEAMAAVLGRGLSPLATQEVYCLAIVHCDHARELTRAHAWTRSMADWLESLSSTRGAYLGRCRVHRARLQFLTGAWPEALEEIAEVCAELDSAFGQAPCGEAYYALGELRRLRGELDEAEEAYRSAAKRGWPTQPGLARLRLAQGDTAAAAAGVRRALAETPGGTAPGDSDAEFRHDRLDLLKAAVAIDLERGAVEAARQAATEFGEIAQEYGLPVVRAEADALRAQIALAEGDPAGALPLLRRAVGAWREHHAEYEVATLCVLVGQACHALGDHDGARLEFSAARETFARLGAWPDLARLDALVTAEGASPEAHGLTPREVEVLGLIARGRSNRAIAGELHLSERTIHRHVSNIFTKLDVDSRTAAVAYGIKHHIVQVGSL